MHNTSLKILRKLSILLGGSFLIFQLFKASKNLLPKETEAIRQVILPTKYRNLLPYIIAQSKHETNNFRSELSLAFNNLFGMKNASRRLQYGIELPNSDFRKYVSHEESIHDFIIYLDFVKFPENIDNLDAYVYELKKRAYFSDSYSNYLGGLQRYV